MCFWDADIPVARIIILATEIPLKLYESEPDHWFGHPQTCTFANRYLHQMASKTMFLTILYFFAFGKTVVDEKNNSSRYFKLKIENSGANSTDESKSIHSSKTNNITFRIQVIQFVK